MMKRYIYILCMVRKPNPEVVELTNGIAEHVYGPGPDIIPNIHPAGITFRHIEVRAENQNDAYTAGHRAIEKWPEDAVCNDYVVEVKGE